MIRKPKKPAAVPRIVRAIGQQRAEVDRRRRPATRSGQCLVDGRADLRGQLERLRTRAVSWPSDASTDDDEPREVADVVEQLADERPEQQSQADHEHDHA